MADSHRRLKRSGLTMPIVTDRFISNAWHRGCDFINMDLEDSVPPELKGVAAIWCAAAYRWSTRAVQTRFAESTMT